jgi:uncharacterized membrane protein YvbJ
MRYCIFCGVKIPGDAKFCQDCGKEQPEPSGSNAPKAATEGIPDPAQGVLASPKGKIILGVGVFVVMIALFTGTIILVNAK